MIKNVLNEIGGVGLYGVVSVCLFFAVFLGSLVLALRHKKPFVERMSALPLDDGSPAMPSLRSADLQSAVSQVCNLRTADNETLLKIPTRSAVAAPCGLQVGDTAGWKPALRDGRPAPAKGDSRHD